MGKRFLVVAGCPVRLSLTPSPVLDSTVFVHLGEGNSVGLGSPTGGSVAPMGLEHEGHAEPLCSAGCCACSLQGVGGCCRHGAVLQAAVSPLPLQLQAQGIQPGVFSAGRTLAPALLWSAQHVV